jgi:hypothetical protein
MILHLYEKTRTMLPPDQPIQFHYGEILYLRDHPNKMASIQKKEEGTWLIILDQIRKERISHHLFTIDTWTHIGNIHVSNYIKGWGDNNQILWFSVTNDDLKRTRWLSSAEPLFSLSEAAKLLGISPVTLQEKVKSGSVPAFCDPDDATWWLSGQIIVQIARSHFTPSR